MTMLKISLIITAVYGIAYLIIVSELVSIITNALQAI